MTSAPKKSGGWGSVFSNAVAGLESRLDTILADESDASAKARAAEEEAKKTTLAAPPPPSKERDASRTRANDRLAERLAKATAVKSASRTQSPATPADAGERVTAVVGEDGGKSSETMIESQEPETSVVQSDEPDAVVNEPTVKIEIAKDEDEKQTDEPAIIPSILPPRLSTESSTRPSIDMARSDVSSRPSMDLPNGIIHRTAPELEAELFQQREEMHVYLEKIDALQAKLTYLAQQTVAAAKEANATSAGDSEAARLAEKDERIALLMQEGETLSKTELRQMQSIKKLRSKTVEDEKAAAELKKKLEKAEQAERELKGKLRRAEVAERQAGDKVKQIAVIEKQVEELKVDRENAAELVRSLTVQLKESKEKAERAEKEAQEKGSEIDKGRIAALENDLEDAQIERKLAETRAEAEIKKTLEDAEGQKQRFSVRELELKNEISILESRVEAMRSRAEEASADGNVSGESSVKLLRQVETLQGQYALAKENWETIEGSLNARLVAIEKERDESNRRETEARKRAREAAVKARKAEEEGEALSERARNLEQELQKQSELLVNLQSRFDQSEGALTDARKDLDGQRRVWESELAQRIEDERVKWQRSQSSAHSPVLNRTESPIPNTRKTSYHAELRRQGPRMASQELAPLQIDSRPVSRRSWNNSAIQPTPVLNRQESGLSMERSNSFPPQTPSIEIDKQPLDDAFEMTQTPADATDSPDRTLADLVSTSTAPAAGPSVQLVERMSALVRRLESEKAATKDELLRLTAQRDSAMDEIVSLMREVEAKRDAERKTARAEGELKVLGKRYEASLEMLGEREEEVEELRGDVRELKRLYRELVEEKLGG